jgi:hypothetical protein
VIETCTSAGGDITVRWDGTALTLTATDPAAGFSVAEQDIDPDRARVEFAPAGDGTRYEVEARGVAATVECDVNTKS